MREALENLPLTDTRHGSIRKVHHGTCNLLCHVFPNSGVHRLSDSSETQEDQEQTTKHSIQNAAKKASKSSMKESKWKNGVRQSKPQNHQQNPSHADQSSAITVTVCVTSGQHSSSIQMVINISESFPVSSPKEEITAGSLPWMLKGKKNNEKSSSVLINGYS